MKKFPSEKRIVKEFFHWVKIDSPSGKEEKISAEIAKRLKTLGINMDIDKTGNIKGTVPGTPGMDKLPFRYFAAHIDTVQPGEGVKPVLKNGKITSSGNTILGADDKDGLTAMLIAIEYILKEKLPHPPLELIFTVMEEAGTTGSRQIKKSWLKSKFGWVLDGPGKVGTIYKGAIGAAEFKIQINGKAAHSGICPENGINAMKAAANAISRIRLGRLAWNHTVNIGTFQSGASRNIVPETAFLHGETRSTDMGKVKKTLAQIEKVFAQETKKLNAKLSFQSNITYYPFSLDKNAEIIKRTVKTMETMGIKPYVTDIKAGTDANNIHRLGIESAILAMGRQDNHTVEEVTTTENLCQATRLAVMLMLANS